MSRNLVVCLDGTNNQFEEKNTNVVRLFQALLEDPEQQLRYYNPGVGTMGHPGWITSIGRGITKFMGLAFGLGATQNILDGYTFLMRNYREGDRIFLFGFSRGALEARALAALLHRCGLLNPQLESLAPYALDLARTVRKGLPPGEKDPVAEEFKATFSREAEIHFLGLWDTVTSMGNVWSPLAWPHTTNNPSVLFVRHAIALDERRAFFRQNRWNFGSEKPEHQDVKEYWYLGVHCDVGGGYARDESALWTVPHEWMVREAMAQELKIDETRLQAPIEAARKNCNDPVGNRSKIHNSMWGLFVIGWPITEFIPKPRRVKKAGGGFRTTIIWPVIHWLPLLPFKWRVGRARILIKDDHLHRTVLDRYAHDTKYDPEQFKTIKLTREAAKDFLETGEETYVVP